MTEQSVDRIIQNLNIKYIRFSKTYSPLAKEGIRFYEDNKIGFRIGGDDPLEISLRLGVSPLDEYDRVAFGDVNPEEKLQVRQPLIEAGRNMLHARFRQSAHGLDLTPKMLAGAVGGFYHDAFDHAVVNEGDVLGFTVEARGNTNRVLSHQKPLTGAEMREVNKDKESDKTVVSEQGPDYLNEELFYSRRGMMVSALWHSFPTGFRLGKDKEGKPQWQQLPHRFHVFEEGRQGLAVARVKGVIQRESELSTGVNYYARPAITTGRDLLRITVFNTYEDLVPYKAGNVDGYKVPDEYVERLGGENSRCPASGHPLNPDATIEDFGSVITKKGTLGIRRTTCFPIVAFNLAIVKPSEPNSLELFGESVRSCRDCFPTHCYGIHEQDKVITICPICKGVWEDGHICLTSSGRQSFLDNSVSRYFDPKLLKAENF